MRGPPRREKREEGRAEQRSHPEPPAKGAETRNDAMSTQSAWSPGGSLRTRRLLSIRETPCSFYHSLNDLQANHADISEGYECNALFRNFRAGLRAAPQSKKREAAEKEPQCHSSPGPEGSSSVLRGSGTERPPEDYEKEHPGTVRLNTLFPVYFMKPWQRPGKGLRRKPMSKSRIAQFSEHPRERSGPGQKA